MIVKMPFLLERGCKTVMFLIAFFANYFFVFIGGIVAHYPYLLCFSLSFLLKGGIKHGLSVSPLYHLVIPKLLYKSLCGDIHYYHRMILPVKIHRPFSAIFMWTISRHATTAECATVCLCVCTHFIQAKEDVALTSWSPLGCSIFLFLLHVMLLLGT